MNDEFSRFHPLVNIVFYICVLGITMFQMQIGLIIISFIVALIYYIFLKKEWNLKFFCGVIVVFLTSAVINPIYGKSGYIRVNSIWVCNSRNNMCNDYVVWEL